ncbi:glycosyltransferase family 1 protein [Didymella exigua CBS 183.55]|uniref:UDP-N-acetylglucosamine transferase subunit ALG14 n=1 Tax=Didymella exigua CBS 183.55 TaxID=1150837 RepID=A0A6A5RQH3_9PLEO|nr:glycosyltransferase family 1 protein [Didymella exigua CBS 183.55]KAF1928556.1 glycosyltransferase family 1 protein [Didymella exigua CBS 183.55]
MAPPPSTLYTPTLVLALLVALCVAASLRLIAILPSARRRTPHPRTRPARARILVVLGSGGHTHEMLALLRGLDARKYTHRTYVVSSGDAFSAARAEAFERGLAANVATQAQTQTQTQTQDAQRTCCVGPQFYSVVAIPRARRVHQPLYSTPLSALQTLAAAFGPLLSRPSAGVELPHLIVTNGPATAVVVVLAAMVLRFFDVRGAQSRGLCRTVYVESFARVKTLSLSGRLLVRVVDRFVVQWEALEGYAGRAEYGGILV